MGSEIVKINPFHYHVVERLRYHVVERLSTRQELGSNWTWRIEKELKITLKFLAYTFGKNGGSID